MFGKCWRPIIYNIRYYKSRRLQYPGENTWSYLWLTQDSISLMLMVRGQVELVPLTPEALIGSKSSSVFLATLKACVLRKTSNIWAVFCSDPPTKRLGICLSVDFLQEQSQWEILRPYAVRSSASLLLSVLFLF